MPANHRLIALWRDVPPDVLAVINSALAGAGSNVRIDPQDPAWADDEILPDVLEEAFGEVAETLNGILRRSLPATVEMLA